MKKLIPALCMLLIVATLLGTSTYAWFSMNTQVTATGMEVKATAEDGILISNSDKGSWTNTASAKVSTAILVPTSTTASTTPAFVHAASTNSDEAQPNQDTGKYTDLSLTWTNTTFGEGYVDTDGEDGKSANEKAYVLLNEFYIKSSGNALTLGEGKEYADLYINDVTVTGASLAIDNSLRVLVVIGETAYVYAPVIDVAGGTTTLAYKFKNTTDVTAIDATTADGYDKETGTTTIGNTNDTAVKAQVYIYFEGEDANCKSTNISGITTNNLSVTIDFGIVKAHESEESSVPAATD